MTSIYNSALSRRQFLVSSLAGATAMAAARAGAGPRVNTVALRAAPGRARLAPGSSPETEVWCYNGRLPGPEIRVRQGERVRVAFTNALAEDSTIHWHGIRLPNPMDGVAHLTQRPVGPNETFVYEFDAVDAGTFWYHPHQRSSEQTARGLYGALVVEEPNAPRVDRDVTWVLDDWRLTPDGAISDDFDNAHDFSHAGRLGNVVTINGEVPETFRVSPGERIRLRLINAANARIFALDFEGHEPRVVALDGQPVAPHTPADGRIVLGPAMRADLILDCTGGAGARTRIVDRAYPGNAFALLDLSYRDTVMRDAPPDWPVDLPANAIPEPDLAAARRHDVIFTGGMMGGAVERDMGLDPSAGGADGGMMRPPDAAGGIWFVNGRAATAERVPEPFLSLDKDASHVLAMTNATAFHHPIHLHGHSFRVIARNGVPTERREWLDTVLMAPRERVEIAFVADNPGDWMFHCHVLEHQAAGMAGVIRVA